jgi:hypothetical protein
MSTIGQMNNDFEPVVGRKFQFRAEPMPNWDGVVDCEVLHPCCSYGDIVGPSIPKPYYRHPHSSEKP